MFIKTSIAARFLPEPHSQCVFDRFTGKRYSNAIDMLDEVNALNDILVDLEEIVNKRLEASDVTRLAATNDRKVGPKKHREAYSQDVPLIG